MSLVSPFMTVAVFATILASSTALAADPATLEQGKKTVPASRCARLCAVPHHESVW